MQPTAIQKNTKNRNISEMEARFLLLACLEGGSHPDPRQLHHRLITRRVKEKEIAIFKDSAHEENKFSENT